MGGIMRVASAAGTADLACERDNFWLLYPIHFKFDMCININEGKKRFKNGCTMMMPWAHYDETKSLIAHNFWTTEPIYFILIMDVNLNEDRPVFDNGCIMINHERIMMEWNIWSLVTFEQMNWFISY